MPVKVLHPLGLVDGAFDRDLQQAYGELLSANCFALSSIVNRTKGLIAEVQKDRGLNSVGQADRIRQIVASAVSEIEAETTLRRKMLDRDRKAAEQTATLRLPNPRELSAERGVSREVLQLEMQEVRAFLHTQKPLDRDSLIRSAGTNADALTLTAVAFAPSCMRIASAEVLEDATTKYIEAKHPEAIAKLRVVDAALTALRGNADTAAKHLTPAGTTPLDLKLDEIKRASQAAVA